MKKITQLLYALVFCSLMIFISCNKDDGDNGGSNDERAEQAELLEGTWTVTSATYEGNPRPDWNGATVTFSYNYDNHTGTYTVSGVPTAEEGENAASVLGSGSVSWEFEGETSTNTIERADDVKMTVTVTATQLTLSFGLTGVDSRTAGFDGQWKFELEPAS